MSKSNATLKDIASLTGLSLMTVSRALRNAPRVAEATRAKVLAAARELGYSPDPHLARMMQMVRSRKPVHVRATLAVIREHILDDALLSQSYQYVPIEDIRCRARGYGYEVEEFWLGRNGLSPERLNKILYARGIEGMIVSPQSEQLPCRNLDYTAFSAVTFGYAMRDPLLHIATSNMTLGIKNTAQALREKGYRRIGLVVTKWIDDRSQFGYSGGMFHFQQSLAGEEAVPLLLLPHNDIKHDFKIFSSWMKEHEPDVLISFDSHVPEWLGKLKLRIPEDIGFVVHDWTPRMEQYAGINHRRDQVAAAAVDLVVSLLSQNECGIPFVPRQIMITPTWVDGPSI
jgi:DNA-binding LacI/PurR family transcriptional regulator